MPSKKQEAGGIFDTVLSGASSLLDKVTSQASGASAASGASTPSIVDQARTAAEEAAAKQAIESSTLSTDEQALAKEAVASSGGIRGFMDTVNSFFTDTLPATGAWVAAGFTFSEAASRTQIGVVWGTVLLVGIGITVYILNRNGYFDSPKAQEKKAEDVANKLNAQTAQTAQKEAFQNAPIPPIAPAPGPSARTSTSTIRSGTSSKLVDAQPLTIKQAGFLGPVPEGNFDAEKAISQALRAGFRAFVLQIDYLTASKDREKYGEPGQPLLLYRDATGALRSKNSATIEEVASTIASLAFRPEVPNSSKPILLYLHVLRAPSAIRTPDDHMFFMSCIGRALKPLAPFHLGMTPLGDFHRQKLEGDLVKTPLSFLEGQVVIMSNINTSMFRSQASAPGTPKYNPADDLDYWVNLRVYLNSDADSLGVAQVPEQGVTPSAVVVKLADVLALPQTRADAFAVSGKSRFVIAMPDPLKNPTAREIDTALNSLGVNMVPIDIFSGTIEETQSLLSPYQSETWHAKPAALQATATTQAAAGAR